MRDAHLITNGEAAAILSLTPAAVLYIGRVRRQLTPHRRKRAVLFSLSEVETLRDQRAGQRKLGRPSGRDLLARRFEAVGVAS